MVNKVTIVGIVRDSLIFKEIRPGSCYHQFQVGTDRDWIDSQSGKRKRTVDWLNVIAWNKSWLTGAVQAGDIVYVSGRIQSREAHKDEATGKVYYRTEVVADDIRNVTTYRETAESDLIRASAEFGGQHPDLSE